MEYTDVTPAEFASLEGVDDWRYVLGGIVADYACGSFGSAAALGLGIADLAERMRHHPDVDLRYPDRLRVSLTTHAVGGLTELDVALAREISELASGIGASVGQSVPQRLELAIDTMDAARIRPFWTAVLGYVELGGVLVDPLRIGPPLWFQDMDEPRPDRNRIHLDIDVPHDQAERRIADALAAGGTTVDDRNARSWWVLADADGNEACVCTWQDR